MEVHHHASHGKKSFKEYFLEFLMIFLAVTMGFLAESLREHITEKKKEKEFIKGFVADLKTDTTKLSGVIKYYEHSIPLMDSSRKNFALLQQPGSLHTVMSLQRAVAGFEDFIYTDATLQQVKSSGGMLLIKNKAAVDSILAYDAKVKSALIDEKVLGDLLTTTVHEMGGLLDMQSIVEPLSAAKTKEAQKAVVDSLNKNSHDFLLHHDAALMGQFYNDFLYYQTIAILVKMEMTAVKLKAMRVLAFLQKEYQLTDKE
ncbi:MAG: hypothetical protein ABJA78_16035 [Ferruginibacter sp.]